MSGSPATAKYPVDTLHALLVSQGLRITKLERRPTPLQSLATLAVVATASDITEPDVAYYAVDDQTVRHQGTTYTLAEWQARP